MSNEQLKQRACEISMAQMEGPTDLAHHIYQALIETHSNAVREERSGCAAVAEMYGVGKPRPEPSIPECCRGIAQAIRQREEPSK